jgi:hypothetical protein
MFVFVTLSTKTEAIRLALQAKCTSWKPRNNQFAILFRSEYRKIAQDVLFPNNKVNVCDRERVGVVQR